MRIDLSPTAMPELGRSADAIAGAKPGDTTQVKDPNADDVAHLSSGTDAVQKLKEQLAALPEVRQERVDALKQAISEGTYRISPRLIATAMLADAARNVG